MHIGKRFPSLDELSQARIIETIGKQGGFEKAFHRTLRDMFLKVETPLQKKILEFTKIDDKFQKDFSLVADNFSLLDASWQEKMFECVKRNPELARTLGWRIGSQFSSLDASLQERVFEFARTYKDFSASFEWSKSQKNQE